MNPELLAILRCPCDPSIGLEKRDQGFICSQCKVVFPIRDNIPCFLIDEALLPPEVKGVYQLPCQKKEKPPKGGEG